MNVTPLPCFNFAETEKVARAVGFNPNPPGAARDCLQCAKWVEVDFPDGLSESLRKRALFYVALGIFIYSEYIELGEPLSPLVREWYELNTALTVEGTAATELFMWGLPDE